MRALLNQHWLIDADEIAILHGGMNSRTWEVTSRADRWVLKLVPPHTPPGFRAGLFAAAALDAAGLHSGAPVTTRDNQLAVQLPQGTAALLTWVEGAPLSSSPGDVLQIGRMLATAHSVLQHVAIPDAPPFDWIACDAAHLDVEPWVRRAVTDAVREWQDVRSAVTTWGFLHGDPAPEVFLHDQGTNTYGIIDWASGVRGPLLYDLASAAMYLGREATPTLVEAYASHGTVPRAEIERGLPTLQRYRYAVQADYFARRLQDNNLTGIDDPADNQEGLDDARAMLGA